MSTGRVSGSPSEAQPSLHLEEKKRGQLFLVGGLMFEESGSELGMGRGISVKLWGVWRRAMGFPWFPGAQNISRTNWRPLHAGLDRRFPQVLIHSLR